MWAVGVMDAHLDACLFSEKAALAFAVECSSHVAFIRFLRPR